jgi:hypothetical protein
VIAASSPCVADVWGARDVSGGGAISETPPKASAEPTSPAPKPPTMPPAVPPAFLPILDFVILPDLINSYHVYL